MPFVRAWTGICVNLFLDDNNCGAIGSNCSNTSTHCSTGICSSVPTVQLTSFTPLWVGGNNGSIDDAVFSTILPFNITLYNTKTSSVQMTTNGVRSDVMQDGQAIDFYLSQVLCFSDCSNAYQGTSLPTTNVFTDVTMFPCWADLYISAKTWQGLYVGSTGTAPARQLTFEYYLSHFSAPTTYAHFNVRFFENRSNIVEFNYFEVDDQGTSCTVGVQGIIVCEDTILYLIDPLLLLSSFQPERLDLVFLPSIQLDKTRYDSDVRHKLWQCHGYMKNTGGIER